MSIKYPSLSLLSLTVLILSFDLLLCQGSTTSGPVDKTVTSNSSDMVTTPQPKVAKNGRAWLRLCSPGGGGDNILGTVKAGGDCSAGYWFQDTVKVGCACGHGVWVFSKGWCDKGARVILAYGGSCFSIDKDVRYIRHIGYPQKPYMPYHFQTTSGFEYIQELPINLQYTYFSPKYDQHLGAIFPKDMIQSENSRRCVEFNATQKSAVGMKYFADKLPYRQVPYCYKPHGRTDPMLFDDFFQIDEFFGMREKTKDPLKPFGPKPSWNGKDEKCSLQCPAPEELFAPTEAPVAKGSTFLPDYYDPLDDIYGEIEYIEIPTTTPGPMGENSTEFSNSTQPDSAKNSSVPDVTNMKHFRKQMKLTFPLFEDKTLPICDNSTHIYSLTEKVIKEINLQTRRMILVNLEYSLKNVKPLAIEEVNDYSMFQTAKKILKKVCPNEEVPHALLSSLLMMFRAALRETLRMYPFEDKTGDEMKDKIWKGLNACLETARPMYFDYKNSTSPNDTCPQLSGITYKYKGDSGPTRTLFPDMPEVLRSNVDKLDLPVETAWKTIMFTHYYCSRHFTTNTSAYSHFYDKMEMFFNRWMLHRWLYPGPSYAAYQHIYPMYDLKRFGDNLDKCVGASRSFSNYRRWIRRPIYVKNCGGPKFQSKSQARNLKKPKLDFITPELTEFGDRAYCLPHWHSPVSNPGINYDPMKDGIKDGDGCIQYKDYEWEDDITPNVKVNWANKM